MKEFLLYIRAVTLILIIPLIGIDAWKGAAIVAVFSVLPMAVYDYIVSTENENELAGAGEKERSDGGLD